MTVLNYLMKEFKDAFEKNSTTTSNERSLSQVCPIEKCGKALEEAAVQCDECNKLWEWTIRSLICPTCDSKTTEATKQRNEDPSLEVLMGHLETIQQDYIKAKRENLLMHEL